MIVMITTIKQTQEVGFDICGEDVREDWIR